MTIVKVDFITFVELLDEDTVEDVFVELLEDPYDYDTRETVREILMEDLLSDFDFDGTGFCAVLFGLLDFEKQQQQQIDTTPANARPIAIPPTNPI